MNFEGEIETHITLDAIDSKLSPELEDWAQLRGLKFVHILLDRGLTPSQPMFTRVSEGTLTSELAAARDLVSEIEKLGYKVNRIKLEVPPFNKDVPTHNFNISYPRYFEHHVKILVPPDTDLAGVENAIQLHGAHLSRNARRQRPDGQLEHFITQRCYRVGSQSARLDLEKMMLSIRFFQVPILEVEEEYVIYDSNLTLDEGWIEDHRKIAVEPTYPKTLRALNPDTVSDRPLKFDPALQHFSNAFQLAESPYLTDIEREEINLINAEVRNHILRLVASSRWREHLILRGSTLMKHWFGNQAREPKDIDWVFQPATVGPNDSEALECCRELIDVVQANTNTEHAVIQASEIALDEIWTYERTEGKRIVFPFVSDKGVKRELQLDIVWCEELLSAPQEVSIQASDSLPITLRAVSQEESLVWKLMWLLNDAYPQGKDIFDATLLAEEIHLSEELKAKFLLYTFPAATDLSGLSLEEFIGQRQTDWSFFKFDHPMDEDDLDQLVERLKRALVAH